MVETESRKDKIDALANALEKMWSGGGGECGVYTVAIQRDKVRKLLHELLDEP